MNGSIQKKYNFGVLAIFCHLVLSTYIISLSINPSREVWNGNSKWLYIFTLIYVYIKQMRAITHHFCPIFTIMEYFHDLYEMMHGLKYIQYGCLNISHQIIDKNH